MSNTRVRSSPSVSTAIAPNVSSRISTVTEGSARSLWAHAGSRGLPPADAKLLDQASAELAQIAGQQPSITRARKSISNFKLREGMAIGCRVTLRGQRMYEFLDRMVNLALPRVRDFRGVSSKAFDGRGNYTLGLKDQLIFPEINYNKVQKVKGMNVSIVTTARTDEESRVLLKELGMPFRS